MKILKYLANPLMVLVKMDNKNLINLSDKLYLKILYKYRIGKKLNIENPRTYNEKLQWLKLYDRKKTYSKMVDKYEVKEYVKNIIGEKYIIPSLGIYDSFDEINFNELPKQFVMKCTHDSGGLVIVKNKEELDFVKAKEKIEASLKNNYYKHGREWPYKNVKPRILVEQYMEDKNDKELRDYKLFCFNGKYKLMFIASNRQGKGETYFDFFDKDFNHLPFTNGHPNSPKTPHKPQKYGEMIKLAEKLSKNIPQVRVDFYEVNGKIYFGEITFFHWSGLTPFVPEEWDRKLGDLIELPKTKKIEKEYE